MDLELSGKAFLVTGGSRGLGYATAAALVEAGAKVLLVARDEAVLRQAANSLGGAETAVGLVGDIAEASTSERAVAATVARFGRLDGCLLSTGGPTPGGVMTTPAGEWASAFERLVLGSLRMARAVASATFASEGISGTGGSILFVLSTSVKSPIPGLAISNALRPGLAMIVKDLADELGPRGLRVNGLAPGRFATDRVLQLDSQAGNPESVRLRNESQIPLRRYGEPEEFGRMATILLSPVSSYITGTVVYIDGGNLRCI